MNWKETANPPYGGQTTNSGMPARGVSSVLLLVLLMGFATTASLAAELARPLVSAVRVDKPPSLDGSLADEPWQYAFRVFDFHVITKGKPAATGRPPKHPTTMMLVYTDKALFVAFNCVKRVKGGGPPPYLAEATGKGPDCAREDSVNVLLHPEVKSKTCYQFVANPVGGTYEGAGEKFSWNDDWDGLWRSATVKTPTGWAVEIEIPFASLGRSIPAEGEVWGFAAARMERALREVSVWSDQTMDFYDPERYGRCRFVGRIPEALVTQIADARGANLYYVSPPGSALAAASPALAPPVKRSPVTNLPVTNASFEQGLMGWRVRSPLRTTTKSPARVTGAHRWSGKRAVCIRAPGRWRRVALEQQITRPPPGRFEATVMYHPESEADRGRIHLTVRGSGAMKEMTTRIHFEICIARDKKRRDGWYERTLRFTVPPQTPLFWIGLGASDGAGPCCFDDVSIRRVKSAPLPNDGMWYWDASWKVDGNLPRKRFRKMLAGGSPFVKRARRFNELLIRGAITRDDVYRLHRAALYAGRSRARDLDRRCDGLYERFDRSFRLIADIYAARMPERLAKEVDPLLTALADGLDRLKADVRKGLGPSLADALRVGEPASEETGTPYRIAADGTPNQLLFGSWGKVEFREMAPSLGIWNFQGTGGPAMAKQRPDGSYDWSGVTAFQKQLVEKGSPYFGVRTRILTGNLPMAIPKSFRQYEKLAKDPDAYFADRGYFNYWNPEVQRIHIDLAAALAREVRDAPDLLFTVFAWEPGGLRHITVMGDHPKKRSETAAFRAFLRETYGSVKALNSAWRTSFGKFGEIQVPKWNKKRIAAPAFYEFRRCRQVNFTRLCKRAYEASKKNAPGKPVLAGLGGVSGLQSVDAASLFEFCDILDTHGARAASVYACSEGKAWNKNVAIFENNWQMSEVDRWGDERAHFGGTAKYLYRLLLLDHDLQFWCFPYTSQVAWIWRQAQWSSLSTDYLLLRYAASALPMAIRRARILERVLRNTRRADAEILLMAPRTALRHNVKAIPAEVDAIIRVLRASGLNFEYRNERRVETNKEKLSRYKVIILPHAYYLADGVARKLLAWTQSGGLLVCIGPAGVYDKFGFDDGALMRETIGTIPRLISEEKYIKDYEWDFGGPKDGPLLVVKSAGRGKAVVTRCPFGEFLENGDEIEGLLAMIRAAAPPWAVVDSRDVELWPLADAKQNRYLGVLNDNCNVEVTATITLRGAYKGVVDFDLPGGVAVPVKAANGLTRFQVLLAPASLVVFALEQ